jgi:hypothetical protein
MRTLIIGMLTAGTLLTAAIPATAQTRPNVSSSESSRSTGPTCVVNGDATACETSGVSGSLGGTVSLVPAPVIIATSPILFPIFGGDSEGRAATDTDVSRSTRNGSALER